MNGGHLFHPHYQPDYSNPPWSGAVARHFDSRLDKMERLLYKMGERMTLELKGLTDEVETVVESVAAAVVALNDLAAKFAGAGDTENQAAVDAITARLAGAADALTAAVTLDDPPAPAAATPTADQSSPPSAPAEGF
jgi:hypothetical protein